MQTIRVALAGLVEEVDGHVPVWRDLPKTTAIDPFGREIMVVEL